MTKRIVVRGIWGLLGVSLLVLTGGPPQAQEPTDKPNAAANPVDDDRPVAAVNPGEDADDPDRPVVADDSEVYAIKGVFRRFYRNYERLDWDAMTGALMRSSPATVAFELHLHTTLQDAESVKLQSLQFDQIDIKPNGQTAFVRLTHVLTAKNSQTGKQHDSFTGEPRSHVVELHKVQGRWKIWFYGPETLYRKLPAGPVVADDPDAYQLKSLVREFFRGYAAKDIAAVDALWDPSAPRFDLFERRRKGAYADFPSLSLRGIRFEFAKIYRSGSFARVLARVWISGIEAKTGKRGYHMEGLWRHFQFRKRDGRWKLWLADVDLYENVDYLATARTYKERHEILDELNAEMNATSGVPGAGIEDEKKRRLEIEVRKATLDYFLSLSVAQIPDPERRLRIIREESRLTENDGAVLVLAKMAVRFTQSERIGNFSNTEQKAIQLLDTAEQIAREYRYAHPLVLCFQARGILLEHLKRYDEALTWLKRARVAMQRSRFYEQESWLRVEQFFNLVHLGRVQVKLGDTVAAQQTFYEADRLYQSAKNLKPDARSRFLSVRAFNRLRERDDIAAKIRQRIGEGKLDEAARLGRQMLDIEFELLGKVHRHVANSHEWLARIHALLGQPELARRHAESHREICRQFPGSKDFYVRWSTWLGGHIAEVAKRTAEQRTILAEAYAAWHRAEQHGDRKDYKQSIPLWRKVVELYSTVLAEEDFLLARSRWYLAINLRSHGDLVAAESLLAQVVPVYVRVLGVQPRVDGPSVKWFSTMSRLAHRRLHKGDFQGAVAWRDKALAVIDRYHGSESKFGKEARTIFEELNRTVKLTPEDHQQLGQAGAMRRESLKLLNRGLRTEAIKLARQAVDTHRRLTGLGTRSGYLASYTLGRVLFVSGRHAEAERVMRPLLTHRSPATGYKYVVALSLGQAVGAQSRYVEAERLLAESVRLARSEHGFRTQMHVQALTAHARYLDALGQSQQANRKVYIALMIQKQLILPSGHKHFTDGFLPFVFDEEELAGKTLRGSGPHRRYAELLRHHVRYARSLEGFDVKKAELFLKAALELFKEIDGTDRTLNYDSTRSLLAGVYRSRKRYKEAAKLVEAGIEYQESLHAQTPLSRSGLADLASDYRDLAICHSALKDVDEAARMIGKAAALLEEAHWTDNTLYAKTLADAGWVAFRQQRYAEALAFLTRGLQIRHQILQTILQQSSESVMRSYAANEIGPKNLLEMAAAAPPEFRDKYVRAAYDWTVRRRALITTTLCRIREREHAMASDPEVRNLALKLRGLRQSLNKLQLSPPANLSPLELRQERERLQRETDKVEADLNDALAKASAANAASDSNDEVNAGLIQQKLPQSTALVEFVRVSPVNFAKYYRDRVHYFAFVVTAGEKPQVKFVDLGEAATIDQLVARYREQVRYALRSYGRTSPEDIPIDEADWVDSLQGTSSELYERLIVPLKPATASVNTWYIVPEGELNRLPFEALIDEDNQYLIESTRIAYLTSGRDLLRPPVKPAEGTVIFAGAEFDLDPDENDTERKETLAKVNSKPRLVALRGSVANGVRGMRWTHLPATLAEAADIRETLDGSNYGPVTSFVGRRALEDVLKAMPAPRILHLATHGFFLPNRKNSPGASNAPLSQGTSFGQARGFARLRKADNPLLRSGIVLTGANALGHRTDGEDGWLTAQEIALLDLHGTDLVVLSACESGLGQIETGEGVQGLRVAFRYAGARTLINTLFKVPDEPTQQLMKEFYKRLKKGESKLDALRNAQLTIITERRKDHDVAHPLFWGSFVLIGDAE